MKRVYLAGPFFNEPQRSAITALERAIEGAGMTCFSPSRDGVVCPPDGTEEQRQQAFKINHEEIDRADLVVAVLDWLLPKHQELRIVDTVGLQGGVAKPGTPLPVITGPIKVPDSGTVWEMGYAFAKYKPVITVSLAGAKLNLMLALSTIGHAQATEQLSAMLDKIEHLPLRTPSDITWAKQQLKDFAYAGKVI